jgi:hypothetical protein
MTAPTHPAATLDAAILAELNDLLKLDHDAVEAYTLAIGALSNVGRRETVVRFRADHDRHIAELTHVIRRHGGTPAERPHAGSGPFKLAMQGLGALGGDRAVVLAFRTNEGQVCEKYARAATHAAEWPEDVRDVVTAAADDETRHYEWAESQLETLGVEPASDAGRLARAVERVQGRLADGAERVESTATRGLEAARRRAAAVRERLPEPPSERALVVGALAAGVGFLVAFALNSARRR